jgi:hypothetical protein
MKITLSPELRVLVPNAGGIHPIIYRHNATSIVMEHNSNWLIPTLDKSSIRTLIITYGVLGVVFNCCSYSPLESP